MDIILAFLLGVTVGLLVADIEVKYMDKEERLIELMKDFLYEDEEEEDGEE